MTDDARAVVDTYFTAWKNNDFATMRSVLDDKVDFAGPIDRLDNADAYQQAISGLSQMKTDIVIRKTFVDGPDLLTWYDLHTKIAAPAPVAEWSHVDNGKITMVRVVFDARPFSPQQPTDPGSVLASRRARTGRCRCAAGCRGLVTLRVSFGG